MGGQGSGPQFGAATTDTYLKLDVRWLKRRGLLTPGSEECIAWSSEGKPLGTVQIRAEQDCISLTYSTRGEPITYSVKIVTTACHLGGRRPWFLCPARGCGRRVAILYGECVFACRTCHQLAYACQRELPEDRAYRRMEKIRTRLGWSMGDLDGTACLRPKGMHQGTFERLCAEHDRHAAVMVQVI